MTISILMPTLSSTIKQGNLAKRHVKEGEDVVAAESKPEDVAPDGGAHRH